MEFADVMGSAGFNLQPQAHSSALAGVDLFQPPAPFPFEESILFFTQIGKVRGCPALTAPLECSYLHVAFPHT